MEWKYTAGGGDSWLNATTKTVAIEFFLTSVFVWWEKPDWREKKSLFVQRRKMSGCVLCFLLHFPNNQLPQTCLHQKKFLKMTYEFLATRDCTTSLPQTRKFYIYFMWELTCDFVFSDPLYHGAFSCLLFSPDLSSCPIVGGNSPWHMGEGRKAWAPTNPTANWRQEASVSYKKRIKMFPELCVFFWKYSFCANYIRCCFFTVAK